MPLTRFRKALRNWQIEQALLRKAALGTLTDSQKQELELVMEARKKNTRAARTERTTRDWLREARETADAYDTMLERLG